MQLLKNKLFGNGVRLILILFVVLVTILMILNDYLTSLIFSQSFYLTESLLFKITIVLLIIPIMIFSSKDEFTFPKEINISKTLFVLIPLCIIHILVASFFIQFIAQNYLELPFTYEYLIKTKFTGDFIFLLTIYGLMFLIARYYSLTMQRKKITQTTLSIKTGTITEIIIIDDIDWIAAETPYIAIWIDEKKYLYQTTLVNILNMLDHPDFIRIHRSTIVNTTKISYIKSRANGDYDIVLYNKTQLRLSRNYRNAVTSSQLKL
ncbi:MAG: LytTR family transcriptional regulator [Alcanivoracaceae bacterium]|nr:LytTR family transcriptional regulator [Alcanivoracaceae bacterium]